MKAFILCAGYGTRLRPLTEKIPKPLVKIDDKPLLDRIINFLSNYGIKKFVINLHHLGNKIEEFVKKQNYNAEINFSFEKEILGTGGAIKKVKSFLSDDNFIIHNGDILTEFNLNEAVDFHQKNKNDITLLIMNRDSSRKLSFDEEFNLNGWINYTTGQHKGSLSSTFAYSGIQIVSPNIFNYMPDTDKFPVFDFYMNSLDKLKIKGFLINPVYWFDIGDFKKLELARKFFSEKEPQK